MFMTFDELKIAEPILRAVREKGYTVPTPIQEKGIPVALGGCDMLGVARTGTGKTAAFAVPVLQHLWESSVREREEQREKDKSEGRLPLRRERRGRNHGMPERARKIRALVLTPTRELAMQVGECFTCYGKYTGLRHATVFGGVKQGPQTEKLERGVDILVATPGRLHDLIGQGFVVLDGVTHFVLDEADRMLDMGFISDIRRLLPMLPADRQTMLFSATMPGSIMALAKTILSNPVKVEVDPVSSETDTIDQCIYLVEKSEKKNLLISILRKDEDRSVLIFSRTRHGADSICRTLKKSGIQSAAIHGDKSQGERQRALSSFKSGAVKIMVATDIAARGIDICELGMVINYDLPDAAETYVHRIGRTGRAGHGGTALSFCCGDERVSVKDIQKLTGKRIDTVLHRVQ